MLVGKVQKLLTPGGGNLIINFCLVPQGTVQEDCVVPGAPGFWMSELQGLWSPRDFLGRGPEKPELTFSKKLDSQCPKSLPRLSDYDFRAESYLGSPFSWKTKYLKNCNSLLMISPALLDCRHLKRMPTI